MAWLTSNEFTAAVRSLPLGLDTTAAMPSHWSEPMAAALAAAKNHIIQVLVERGYTVAQIEQWDRQREFHRDLAICSLFKQAMLSNEFEDMDVEKFCEKAELLKEILLIVDGEIVDPLRPRNRISTGKREYPPTDDDIFTMDFVS